MKNVYSEVETFFNESYNVRTPECSFETLLTPWKTAKEEYLYSLFGEELIKTKTVLVDPERDNMQKMNDLWCEFKNALFRPIGRLTPYNAQCFSIKELLNNTLIEGELSFRGSTKTLTFLKGTKVLKIMRKVVETFPELEHCKPVLEEFRLRHSQILNTKKKEKELCLSIHPLDYITMSDNEEDWTSCMNWEDGEYHAGTIEMMNSPCVVVAYFKSSRNEYCDWNSKTWRKLYIVTPNLVTGIKAYPYNISGIDREVFKMIAEMRPGHYCPDTLVTIPETRAPIYELENANNDPVIFSFYTNLMYNDFSSIHDFEAMLSENFISEIKNSPMQHYDITYSGPCECMYCGKVGCEDTFISESHYCDYCVNRVRCADCGEIIYGDSDSCYLAPDGNYYCKYCFKDHFRSLHCEHCHEDEAIPKDDFSKYLTIYLESYSFDICPDCYIEMQKEGFINEDDQIQTDKAEAYFKNRNLSWDLISTVRYIKEKRERKDV